MARFEDLPPELILEIIKGFVIKDLLALTLTCKRFNDVISGASELVEKFTFRYALYYRQNPGATAIER